jgi:amino acid permease
MEVLQKPFTSGLAVLERVMREIVIVDDDSSSGASENGSGSNSGDSESEATDPATVSINHHRTRVSDIWALGITIVIGGQYSSWNKGLVAGFGSFAVACTLMGTAYICLVLCLAELSSTLPFAGEYSI